jgi:hypothetical protein
MSRVSWRPILLDFSRWVPSPKSGLRDHEVDSINPRKIHSGNPLQFLLQVESWRILSQLFALDPPDRDAGAFSNWEDHQPWNLGCRG